MVAKLQACANFADDVRFERDGKLIVIGIYDFDIKVVKDRSPINFYAIVKVTGSYSESKQPPVMVVWLNNERLSSLTMDEEVAVKYHDERSEFSRLYTSLYAEFGQSDFMPVVNAVIPIKLEEVKSTSLLYVNVEFEGMTALAGSVVLSIDNDPS